MSDHAIIRLPYNTTNEKKMKEKYFFNESQTAMKYRDVEIQL